MKKMVLAALLAAGMVNSSSAMMGYSSSAMALGALGGALSGMAQQQQQQNMMNRNMGMNTMNNRMGMNTMNNRMGMNTMNNRMGMNTMNNRMGMNTMNNRAGMNTMNSRMGQQVDNATLMSDASYVEEQANMLYGDLLYSPSGAAQTFLDAAMKNIRDGVSLFKQGVQSNKEVYVVLGKRLMSSGNNTIIANQANLAKFGLNASMLQMAVQTFEQSIRQSEYKMLGTALSVGTTTGTVGVVGVTPTTVIGATTGVASTGTIRRGR